MYSFLQHRPTSSELLADHHATHCTEEHDIELCVPQDSTKKVATPIMSLTRSESESRRFHGAFRYANAMTSTCPPEAPDDFAFGFLHKLQLCNVVKLQE